MPLALVPSTSSTPNHFTPSGSKQGAAIWGGHPGCVSVAGLRLTGGKMLTRGKPLEFYGSGQSLLYYFASRS